MSTSACSCSRTFTVEELLEIRDLIFLGVVTSVSASEEDILGCPMNVVTFEVSAHWKGNPGSELELLTEQDSACCGYGFTAGEEYLVYANLHHETQRPETHLCMGTKPSAWAEEDLEILGPPVTPVLSISWGQLKIGTPFRLPTTNTAP
jgi:hypothetical protein